MCWDVRLRTAVFLVRLLILDLVQKFIGFLNHKEWTKTKEKRKNFIEENYNLEYKSKQISSSREHTIEAVNQRPIYMYFYFLQYSGCSTEQQGEVHVSYVRMPRFHISFF